MRRLTQKVTADKVVRLRFQDVGKLPPPVLQFTMVTFGYTSDKVLYRDVDFGVDLVRSGPTRTLNADRGFDDCGRDACPVKGGKVYQRNKRA